MSRVSLCLSAPRAQEVAGLQLIDDYVVRLNGVREGVRPERVLLED